MKKKFLALVIVLSFLITLTGCSESKTEIITYKIGVIAPLSGNTSAYGEQVKRIYDYRLKEINQEGEKKGYKIELIYEDGRCENDSAKEAFEKLTEENIHFIIGGVCTSETLSFAPLLTARNIIAISPTSSNPDLEGISSNLFSLSYSDELVGEGIAEELGRFKKIAFLSEKNEFNEGIQKNVEKYLKEKFPETVIVANEQFEKDSTEFREHLNRIKAKEPEAVLLNPNVGVSAEILLQQLNEIKDWDVQFISQAAYLSKNVLANGPEIAEGMIVVDAPDIRDNEFIAYRNKIIDTNGTLDNLGAYYTASTLDALNIFVELIAKNKGDVDKIQKNLSTETFKGWISKSIVFNKKTFVQGINVMKFVVINGENTMIP